MALCPVAAAVSLLVVATGDAAPPPNVVEGGLYVKLGSEICALSVELAVLTHGGCTHMAGCGVNSVFSLMLVDDVDVLVSSACDPPVMLFVYAIVSVDA